MKSVTIDQIAKHLTLSPSTVSRALRDSDLIQPKTRALVMDAAIKMGYRSTPRSSRSRGKSPQEHSTRIVFGVVCAMDTRREIYHSPILNRFLEGIAIEADSVNATVTMHLVRNAERGKVRQNRDLIASLEQAGCNLLLLQYRHSTDDVAFLSQHFPTVSLAVNYEGLQLDTVLPNDHEGILQMVTLLVQNGHRRIAWVGEHWKGEFTERRRASFIDGALHHGLNLADLILLDDSLYPHSPQSDQMDIVPLLKAIDEGATAFVCANDVTAQQLIQTLQRNNIRVPEDISVTGFDNLGAATSNHRYLTTYDPSFLDLGRLAVRIGMLRLNGITTHKISLTVNGQTIPGQTVLPISR